MQFRIQQINIENKITNLEWNALREEINSFKNIYSYERLKCTEINNPKQYDNLGKRNKNNRPNNNNVQ